MDPTKHWTYAERVAGRMTINTQRRIIALEQERDLLGWRLLSVERALDEVPCHYDISEGALAFIDAALAVSDLNKPTNETMSSRGPRPTIPDPVKPGKNF